MESHTLVTVPRDLTPFVESSVYVRQLTIVHCRLDDIDWPSSLHAIFIIHGDLLSGGPGPGYVSLLPTNTQSIIPCPLTVSRIIPQSLKLTWWNNKLGTLFCCTLPSDICSISHRHRKCCFLPSKLALSSLVNSTDAFEDFIPEACCPLHSPQNKRQRSKLVICSAQNACWDLNDLMTVVRFHWRGSSLKGGCPVKGIKWNSVAFTRAPLCAVWAMCAQACNCPLT